VAAAAVTFTWPAAEMTATGARKPPSGRRPAPPLSRSRTSRCDGRVGVRPSNKVPESPRHDMRAGVPTGLPALTFAAEPSTGRGGFVGRRGSTEPAPHGPAAWAPVRGNSAVPGYRLIPGQPLPSALPPSPRG
jgi:hypothetical protein